MQNEFSMNINFITLIFIIVIIATNKAAHTIGIFM